MANFDTVLLIKQNWCKSKDDIWVFQHIIHHARWKQKQPFTFWYCVDNFYPWKDIVGKKVSKLTLSLTAGGPIGQHFFECKML